MLIPKANRKAIHQYLFNEGVIVVKKDFNLAKHPDIPSVPNLQVIKALQSLKSRGFVNEIFSWQYYYYVLTDAGISFLRAELHLPESVVPSTIAKALKTDPAASERRGPGSGSRREYGSNDKKLGAGADFKPDFRSGFGRGRPAEPTRA